jgi:hypothetical protein
VSSLYSSSGSSSSSSSRISAGSSTSAYSNDPYRMSYDASSNRASVTSVSSISSVGSTSTNIEHLYNIQCSEICTLSNEKLHTEA